MTMPYIIQPEQYNPQPTEAELVQPSLPSQPYTSQYFNYYTREALKKRGSLDDLFELPEKEDMSDILEVSDEDFFESPVEEDMSDILEVSEEDIMGVPPKPRVPKYKPPVQHPLPQQPQIGGVYY